MAGIDNNMNDLSTKILAAGLCDEGVAVEKLELEIKRLNTLISAQKPFCPYCKVALRETAYEGYYECFDYWACDCKRLPNRKRWAGSYTT